MQIWGSYKDTMPHMPLSEARYIAHRDLIHCKNELTKYREKIKNLFFKHGIFNKTCQDWKSHLLITSIQKIEILLSIIIRDYLILFNNDKNQWNLDNKDLINF